MTTAAHPLPAFTKSEILRIAADTDTDPRSVERELARMRDGQPSKSRSGARIRRHIESGGVVAA